MKLLVFVTVLIFIALLYGYLQFKLTTTKNAVIRYLINEKGISDKDIEEMNAFVGMLAGDKNWLVYIKLKDDEKDYYYYYIRSLDKVELESYTFKGKENHN